MSSLGWLNEKHITNAFVYIEGEKVEFVSLSLEQSFGEHHKFSVKLDYDVFKKSFLNNPLTQVELIGKQLDIDLQQGNESSNVYEFRGVICEVIQEAEQGRHGFLILEGFSPTILLERGKRLDIFSNLELNRVFEEVINGLSNNLPSFNKPVYTGQVQFLMQYWETDWEFLQRLSAISGETLFYTGRDLVFGQYEDWETIEATYDKEITGFKFGSKLISNSFSRYQYLETKDETIDQDAPSSVEGSNDYINMASERGKDLMDRRPAKTPLLMPVEDKGSLDDLVNREKTANAAKTIYINGTAKTCVARIGRLLSVNMPENIPEAKGLGVYRITKVKHIIDQNHHYESEFEGVPASLKFLPTPELKIPVADSIRATVIKNDDPQGQGRVRVEFPFAQDRVSEVWLRVMTPDAGSSDSVSKNRGMVFVPDIGDQVMVGFEFGDPNRPYVMGSMFHGKNSEGGGVGNRTRSLTDKTGSTVTLNGEEGSVRIKDKSGSDSSIILDGSQNIILESGASLSVTIAQKQAMLNMDSEGNISITGMNNISLAVGGSLIEMTSNNISISGETVDILGSKNHIKGNTDINGGNVKIN